MLKKKSKKPKNPARIGGAWICEAKDGSEYVRVGIRKEDLARGLDLAQVDDMADTDMVNFVLLENSFKEEDKHPDFNVLIRTPDERPTRRKKKGLLKKRKDDVALPEDEEEEDEETEEEAEEEEEEDEEEEAPKPKKKPAKKKPKLKL